MVAGSKNFKYCYRPTAVIFVMGKNHRSVKTTTKTVSPTAPTIALSRDHHQTGDVEPKISTDNNNISEPIKKVAKHHKTKSSPQNKNKSNHRNTAESITSSAETTLSSHHFTNVIDVIQKYDQVKTPKNIKLDPLDRFAKANVTLDLNLSRSVRQDDLTPTSINLPYHRFDINKVRICLFVPDPQSYWKDKIAEEIETASDNDNDNETRTSHIANSIAIKALKRIINVMDYTHLSKNYTAPIDRAGLRREYDLFICHPRLVNIVTSLLGATFYRTNTFLHILDIPRPPPEGRDTELEQPLAPLVEALLRRTYFRMKPGNRL